ncbi:MAG: hypothetical protein LBP19_05220 [Treponema sp.]|jgi:hypothetical protein|nr:hypothetical protein [Treponema sp.]
MAKPHFYRKKTAEQKEAICQKIIDLMGNGSIVDTIAKNLRCSKVTFFAALKEFPELREAYDIGHTAFVSWFDNVFKSAMLGIKVIDENTNQKIKINPTLAIFYAKVHCDWHETENRAVSVSGSIGINGAHIARLEKNLELFFPKDTDEAG